MRKETSKVGEANINRKKYDATLFEELYIDKIQVNPELFQGAEVFIIWASGSGEETSSRDKRDVMLFDEFHIEKILKNGESLRVMRSSESRPIILQYFWFPRFSLLHCVKSEIEIQKFHVLGSVEKSSYAIQQV